MSGIGVICKRELLAYFSTPLAYVFIVIFLALSGSLTFFMGSFFDRGQADLNSFFFFPPLAISFSYSGRSYEAVGGRKKNRDH